MKRTRLSRKNVKVRKHRIKKIWSANNWLQLSKNEYDAYKKNNKITDFAQASEKLWNSFNLYMSERVGKKLLSYSAVKNEVEKTKDFELSAAFIAAYDLHKFFYRGEVKGYTDDIKAEEGLYDKVYGFLNRKVIK